MTEICVLVDAVITGLFHELFQPRRLDNGFYLNEKFCVILFEIVELLNIFFSEGEHDATRQTKDKHSAEQTMFPRKVSVFHAKI